MNFEKKKGFKVDRRSLNSFLKILIIFHRVCFHILVLFQHIVDAWKSVRNSRVEAWMIDHFETSKME